MLNKCTPALLILKRLGSQEQLQSLRSSDPENFDRFEAQMRLHRAWFFGDSYRVAQEQEKLLSSSDVVELSKQLRTLARQVAIMNAA
jgi:Rps23 Pro-64 3,4-dihydroxylase Tpa1-like proline 4-hydroxylase